MKDVEVADNGELALPRWEYATPGPLRERLSGLTLVGAKTTTFGIDEIAAALNEPLERVGDRFVMRGTNGAALAVIEVTAIDRMALRDVPWDLVRAEGESFRDVEHWRTAHLAFWAPFVDSVRTHLGDERWSIGDDTIVTCVHVRMVERLGGVDAARYPIVECVVDAVDLELVADALIELGSIGVEELLGPTESTAGQAVSEGMVLLRAGFANDSDAVHAEAELSVAWRPRYEVLLGDSWLDAWREHFTPVRVGRIVIVPDWPGAQSDEEPTSANSEQRGPDVIVRLDPARSWGTGAHPSTHLALSALQQLDLADKRVIDMGCGSGVLSVAALLLGASSAVGIDVETAALDATLDNARRNGVESRCAVAASRTSGLLVDVEPAPVVVANILAPVLIAESSTIASLVAPAGMLVLAGLIDTQRTRMLDAYPDFSLVDESSAGPWLGLTLRRVGG